MGMRISLLFPALVGLVTGISAGAAAGAAAGAPIFARNWPAWRGPLATGASLEAQPPLQWAENRNVKWKVAVPGRGTASPVVWEDLVFLLTAIPITNATTASPSATTPANPSSATDGRSAAGNASRRGGPAGPGGAMTEMPTTPQKITVLAYDRGTGKIRWQKSPRTQLPHEGHHRDHGYASASPVTDGEVLVASFGSFGVYGYDLRGNLLWEKDLGRMQTRNGFGEGSSPALDGESVVVLWDHEGEDFIVSLDKRTGKERWRQRRTEPTGWCTPLILGYGGQKQVVVNGTNKARSYDLATGKLLWECAGQTANAIPSAVADAERVYIMSGFRGANCQAITLGRTGDLTGTDAIAWSLNKGTPYVPSPLLSNGRLYFYAGNNPQLSSYDARTGKVDLDTVRLAGMNGVYASPVAAAGRVYLTGRDGVTLVIKDGPGLELLATNKLDENFDATPALAGTDLFLRGQEALYCLSTAARK